VSLHYCRLETHCKFPGLFYRLDPSHLHVSADVVLQIRGRKYVKKTKARLPLVPNMLQVHRSPASIHPRKREMAEKMKCKQRVRKVMKHLSSTVHSGKTSS
jgi:hypothetical protein